MGRRSSAPLRKNFPLTALEKSYSRFMSCPPVLPGFVLGRLARGDETYHGAGGGLVVGVADNQHDPGHVHSHRDPSLLSLAVLVIKLRQGCWITKHRGRPLKRNAVCPNIPPSLGRIPLTLLPKCLGHRRIVSQRGPSGQEQRRPVTAHNGSPTRGWPGPISGSAGATPLRDNSIRPSPRPKRRSRSMRARGRAAPRR